MMNKNIFEGNWKQIKGKLKQQWGKFTDDEIDQMEGQYDKIAGALQKKYGYDQEHTEKELENFAVKNKLDKSKH